MTATFASSLMLMVGMMPGVSRSATEHVQQPRATGMLRVRFVPFSFSSVLSFDVIFRVATPLF
jgi:hypothetical protein